MTIRVVAVKSDEFASDVIRWGLGEDASHLAIQIGDYVFHSVMEGVMRVSSAEFWAAHHFVAQAPLSSRIDWEPYLDAKLCGFIGMPYDQPAFTFFAWAAFKRRVFGQKLPKKNLLNTKNEFLCVELFRTFETLYMDLTQRKPLIDDSSFDFSILTPMDAVKYAQKAWG